ncbi:MAG TPA: VanZ family protein, partial [Chiayiivirga sp.]|nr:VanZ family protein [Chiayiivirga sp.]
ALVLLGIGLEYAQGAFTDYRTLDMRDALANTLGVIAGLGTQLTPLRDLLLRIDGGRKAD